MNRATTVSQIVDENGSPCKACHTEPLWVDKTETDVFAPPTSGNKIESFTTGQEYFDRLILECDGASSEIYIAGWQVNWDALIAGRIRLYELLFRCAKRGVNIYVMPWDDTEPVQTYDDQTKAVLESLNSRVAMLGGKGRVIVELCPSFAQTNGSYFSHHQKQVVVDRKVAFVGGIDLAYGRIDDAHFDLRADANGREMLNRYNPGIPSLKTYKTNPQIVDPDLFAGTFDRIETHDNDSGKVRPSNSEEARKRVAEGAWQVRYEKAGKFGTAPNSSALASNSPELTTLDAERQPRMPWQDVHCRIEGPAVSDLTRNFVMRWNVVSLKKLGMPLPPSAHQRAGNAKIQVLRSAPAQHCDKENKNLKKARADDTKPSNKTQQDIHVAMKNLIGKARHFIYIEQQFFVSDFGALGGPIKKLSPAAQYIKDGSGGISFATLKTLRLLCKGDDHTMDRLPQNGILKALLDRLQKAIVDDVTKPHFHVYITLPVHPEGAISDATIAVQVYYTMQTLVFGSHSLLNGIKRMIKARELKDKGDALYFRVLNDQTNREHESIPDESCFKYVTLLNLRNWTKLGDRYVTEQIYVHSKLIIVDDRFVLMGSANVNDRSLLGERDSELAVLVMDEDTERADVNGDGTKMPVRVFAHQLRKKIWKKIFGITSGVRPANHLLDAINAPGNPNSWEQIQKQAQINALLYEEVFQHIPRNFSKDIRGSRVTAKIIPTWQDDDPLNGTGSLTSPMPYQVEFWEPKNAVKNVRNLGQQRGFITALPIAWTTAENIRIPYPTALIAERGRVTPGTDADSKQEIVSILSAKSAPAGGTA
jgi:phospholipase D1/2